jgi:hypothetical protein
MFGKISIDNTNIIVAFYNCCVNILIDSHSLLVIIPMIGLTVGILVSHTPGGQDFDLLTRDV